MTRPAWSRWAVLPGLLMVPAALLSAEGAAAEAGTTPAATVLSPTGSPLAAAVTGTAAPTPEPSAQPSATGVPPTAASPAPAAPQPDPATTATSTTATKPSAPQSAVPGPRAAEAAAQPVTFTPAGPTPAGGTGQVPTAWPACPDSTDFVTASAVLPGDPQFGQPRTLFSVFENVSSYSFGWTEYLQGAAVAPDGHYTVTVSCIGATQVDYTGEFWVNEGLFFATDPSTTLQDTSVAVTITPADRADRPSPVTLTATLTPANAAGSVQFFEKERLTGAPNFDTNAGNDKVGSPVKVVNRVASLTLADAGLGMHVYLAVFTSDNPKLFKNSTSEVRVFVLANPVPPVPQGPAKLNGTAAVNQTVSCTASFTGARQLAYRWLRDSDVIAGAGSASYRIAAADQGKPLACRVSATDGYGGTTSRTSTAVVVR